MVQKEFRTARKFVAYHIKENISMDFGIYWVCGLLPSSGVVKNTTFRKQIHIQNRCVVWCSFEYWTMNKTQ
jgi:hypothetical protein